MSTADKRNVARDIVDAIHEVYPKANIDWFGSDLARATLYVQCEPGGTERVLVLDLAIPDMPFTELVDNVLEMLEKP